MGPLLFWSYFIFYGLGHSYAVLRRVNFRGLLLCLWFNMVLFPHAIGQTSAVCFGQKRMVTETDTKPSRRDWSDES